MKKKLNLISLKKKATPKNDLIKLRGGGTCGCFIDGIMFNRQHKRDGVSQIQEV